jgi:hypothetical protein
MRGATRDRGQVMPMVVLLLVFCAAVALALVHLATAVVERARAAGAADAAALAGAIADRAAADTVARANGAMLVRFEREGDFVVVEVGRGDRRATARAAAVVTLTDPAARGR